MRTLLLGLIVNPFVAHASCTSYDASTGTLTVKATPDTTSCRAAVVEKQGNAPGQAAGNKTERSSAAKLREISNRRYHAEYISGRQSQTYYGQRTQ